MPKNNHLRSNYEKIYQSLPGYNKPNIYSMSNHRLLVLINKLLSENNCIVYSNEEMISIAHNMIEN